IDPGHGGTDPGAVAGGVRESDVALAHALAIGAALQAAGVAVLYTRAEDVGRTLASRARAANDAGAACFVSIHCNASVSTDPHGFQIFHATGSERGEALARAIHDRVTAAIGTTRWSGVHPAEDRKSTRLNSSHVKISYAVLCLNKKKQLLVNINL